MTNVLLAFTVTVTDVQFERSVGRKKKKQQRVQTLWGAGDIRGN